MTSARINIVSQTPLDTVWNSVFYQTTDNATVRMFQISYRKLNIDNYYLKTHVNSMKNEEGT